MGPKRASRASHRETERELLVAELERQDKSGWFAQPATIEVEFPARRRVVAIGDLHGDYRYALSCLSLAGVIDENHKWVGGDTYVVQTGDQVDSYRPTESGQMEKASRLEIKKGVRPSVPMDESDVDVMDLMDEMDRQARSVGGRVISLCGNHEFFNTLGDFRYVTREGLRRWGYRVEGREAAFAPGGEQAVRLARTRPVFVVVGRTLFMHAGFSGQKLLENGLRSRADLRDIDAALRMWLLGKRRNRDLHTPKNSIHGYAELIDFATSERASTVLVKDDGPTTGSHSGGSGRAEDPRCELLVRTALRILDVDRIVVGHTIQDDGITSTCNGATLFIDVGGAHSFRPFVPRRRPQVLEILNDRTTSAIAACDDFDASKKKRLSKLQRGLCSLSFPAPIATSPAARPTPKTSLAPRPKTSKRVITHPKAPFTSLRRSLRSASKAASKKIYKA